MIEPVFDEKPAFRQIAAGPCQVAQIVFERFVVKIKKSRNDNKLFFMIIMGL